MGVMPRIRTGPASATVSNLSSSRKVASSLASITITKTTTITKTLSTSANWSWTKDYIGGGSSTPTSSASVSQTSSIFSTSAGVVMIRIGTISWNPGTSIQPAITTVHTTDYAKALSSNTAAASTIAYSPTSDIQETSTPCETDTDFMATRTFDETIVTATPTIDEPHSIFDCHSPDNSENWHCIDHDEDEDKE